MKSRNNGFTLVEVLVSLLILAIVLGSGFRLFNTVVVGENHIQDKTFSIWVAQNYAVQQQIQKQWPELGENTQKTQLGKKEWVVHLDTQGTDDSQFRKTNIQISQNIEDSENTTQLFSFNSQTIRW